MWAMVGNFLALLLMSVLNRYSLSLNLSDQVWAGTAQYTLHKGRGAASSMYTRVTDTSQTLPLALISCIELWAVDSYKSN